MRHNFRPGDLIELKIDANGIPSGYYRFQAQQGEILVFAVSN